MRKPASPVKRKPVLTFFIESFSLFYNCRIFLCLSSDDKKRVAVRAELVVLLESGLVCLHDVLISAECSY